MARKRMLNTFKEARNAGTYGEYPVLSEGVDPQMFLSRNDRQQPFFLTCEKDTLLIQMSGASTIEFLNSSVNFFRAVPGDFVYVPGGTPHRVIPDNQGVQYRVKANNGGLEAVSFHCPSCSNELMQETWDTAAELSQEAYLRSVTIFNERSRTCASCGAVHPIIDLTGYRWREIAEELRGVSEEQAW
jgi:hypothetical protein